MTRATCCSVAAVFLIAACADLPDSSSEPLSAPVPIPERGALVSATLVTTYSQSSLQTLLAGDGVPLPITHGASIYRVVYESQGPVGIVRQATGYVFVPVGPALNGGSGVTLWAHGTTGIADTCAPTRAWPIYDYQRVLSFAARGSIVSAPDYLGLGDDATSNPAPHSYLVGEPTALSIWDSMRAARQLASSQGVSLSSMAVMLGHSQGGHAVLFAQQYQPAYGSQFDLRAVVAMAPAPRWDVFQATQANLNAFSYTFSSMYLWAATHYRNGPPITDILQPSVAAALEAQIQSSCALSLTSIFSGNVTQIYTQQFLTQGHGPAFATWNSYLAADSPGDFTSNVPVLLVQGRSDTIVFPSETASLQTRMCANGNNTTLTYVDGDHLAPPEVPSAYIPFVLSRVLGVSVPNGCP